MWWVEKAQISHYVRLMRTGNDDAMKKVRAAV
jgi:hypothetical protein